MLRRRILFCHNRNFANLSSICVYNFYASYRSASSSSSTNNNKDHYKTLGVERDATTKEIKSAFYELSKKHHPDMNPDNKEVSAQKFQELSEAYEVLNSDEQRRIYDSLTTEATRNKFYQKKTESIKRAKSWTDLDIDYKDFEHFQRTNRRKRVFYTRANNEADAYKDAHEEYARNYRNERALERERMENEIRAEFEERQRRAVHPIPTFEQLRKVERDIAQHEKSKITKIYISFVPFFIIIGIVYCGLFSYK